MSSSDLQNANSWNMHSLLSSFTKMFLFRQARTLTFPSPSWWIQEIVGSYIFKMKRVLHIYISLHCKLVVWAAFPEYWLTWGEMSWETCSHFNLFIYSYGLDSVTYLYPWIWDAVSGKVHRSPKVSQESISTNAEWLSEFRLHQIEIFEK